VVTEALFKLYLYGSPIAGLVTLIAIVIFLFKKGNQKKSKQLFAIALALCFSGVAAIITIVMMVISGAKIGSLGAMLVIAAPAIGFSVLLGVFPFAWALITRFFH